MICSQFPECAKSLENGAPCKDTQREELCVVSRNVSHPCCKEKGKSYKLDMTGTGLKTLVYRIDGGVITGTDETKCDHAIIIRSGQDGGKSQAVLVELKGEHLDEAMDQLDSMLNLAIVKEIGRSHKLYGRIVHRNSPPNVVGATAAFRKLRARFHHVGGTLKKHEMQFTERYADLDRC